VYVRSLTKAAAPGLRVAGIAARGAAGARLRTARVVDDFFVSGPLQEAALDLLTSPAWRRHRSALRAGLAERRDALVAALARHLPQCEIPLVPAGGLAVWLRLPDGADDVAIAAAAPSAGVAVSAGRQWFPAEPPGPYLRLTYAGAGGAELTEGVRRLVGVVAA
jgi:DNA-binding transcriptional MocR family regulator